MEYQLGATASFLEGPRDLHCGIVIVQEELIRQHTDRNSYIIVMLDENKAGKAGRKDIAGRLSEHCLVKTHVFDRPDAEPEHLTAEEVRSLLPL